MDESRVRAGIVSPVEEPDAVDLLESGEAFADLSSWRKIAVSGTDALAWLNDLISADISDLAPGRARRSLLLSRTGAVQADFTVSVRDGGVLLIQDPGQPSVGGLLERYVLSSDVDLEDRSDDLALFSFPGRSTEPDAPGAALSVPSSLGAGVDLVAPVKDRRTILSRLGGAYAAAPEEAVDRWRIRRGFPRLGVDIREGDLPREAGLMDAVSLGKGCYMGQEAVARLENLGHPRRLVVAVRAVGAVAAGDRLLAGEEEAGEVTSAAQDGTETAALARVRWGVHGGPWLTPAGAEVSRRGMRA